jgi:hypothetical protein
MSYDLEIHSCSDPNVELARLAVEEGFERNGNAFSLPRKNWQLIFHSADKVDPEDIPVSVFENCPE